MASYYRNQSRSSSSRRQFQRSRSIKSDDALEIQGPLDIQGRSVSLEGDFIVHDEIDAYGGCLVAGHVFNPTKGCGKLNVGSPEGKELEIYGNLSRTGHTGCHRLIFYDSLTLIGRESTYSVSEYEEVAGAKLSRSGRQTGTGTGTNVMNATDTSCGPEKRVCKPTWLHGRCRLT
ncbi:hypothetical protein NLU13_2693 [Sarocladium strictum]|uniref:Uncharacterized protein n=1 Tax=Sarocladium strictum TaxID=5046 RepID=A0AA39L9K8_SARSR|nr:hypothetical protein NLU13_2693 [Sarocladium strictum]